MRGIDDEQIDALVCQRLRALNGIGADANCRGHPQPSRESFVAFGY